MKKFLLTMVALVAMSMTAAAQSVYISNGDGAVAYHKSKSCSYLNNSKDVKSVSVSEAKKLGRHECTRCYGTASTAAKKTTTTAKKTTTAARDEKGRFIKKADTEKKTATKKATTTTKKTTTEAKKATTAAKKKATTETKKATTPARDEKGRFIKKVDEKKTTAKKSTKKAA